MKKNMTRLVALLIVAVIALTGCSQAASTVSEVADAVSSAVGQFISGDVSGEVGTLYSTKWFDFEIESIETVASYAGYEPESGYKLIDVVITETCTFEESCPMGTFDFHIGHSSFATDEVIFPLDPLDDSMMPLEFYLAPDETAKYHMVFEVPDDLSGLELVYIEVAEDDSVYATFTIAIKD